VQPPSGAPIVCYRPGVAPSKDSIQNGSGRAKDLLAALRQVEVRALTMTMTRTRVEVVAKRSRNTFETVFRPDETRFRPSAVNANFIRETNKDRPGSAHLQPNAGGDRHEYWWISRNTDRK
jgi:hypothetical protein